MTVMDVSASGDGARVVITVAASTPAAASLSVPAKDINNLIANLRAAADDCTRLSERAVEDPAPPDLQRDDGENSITIADTTEGVGFAVLTLMMGDTHVSVGIPAECLNQVGTTILALSAPKSLPH